MSNLGRGLAAFLQAPSCFSSRFSMNVRPQILHARRKPDGVEETVVASSLVAGDRLREGIKVLELLIVRRLFGCGKVFRYVKMPADGFFIFIGEVVRNI